jgi:hypothetical protein
VDDCQCGYITKLIPTAVLVPAKIAQNTSEKKPGEGEKASF